MLSSCFRQTMPCIRTVRQLSTSCLSRWRLHAVERLKPSLCPSMLKVGGTHSHRLCGGATAADKGNISTPPYVQGQYEGKRRLYFYYVDAVNGFLFLDDTKHRNFTSCFKDKAFLSFFFSRLRLARPKDPGFSMYGAHFRWVSPCGPEMNWIRAEDTPIVFTELRTDPEDNTAEVLAYGGGTITVRFDPSLLEYGMPFLYCPDLGRLYHPEPRLAPEKALLSSPLTIELAKSITVTDDGVAVLKRAGSSHRISIRAPSG